MKVLLVHNFYGSSSPSGENRAFLDEADLLRRHGHAVVEFTRHSDDIRNLGPSGTVLGALSTPWNPFAMRELRRTIERERPDVMHVHNTFPLISPAAFYAVRNFPTATVMTLHNYRIFCAAAIPMRSGLACSECLDKDTVLPALTYGCYRGSRLATAPLAAKIALHRMTGTWTDKVDAFVALTDFQRRKVIDAGLPGDLVHVKSPCHPCPPSPVPWSQRENKVVFIGRIGPEKGVHLLLDAWMKWGENAPFLEIIGEGPERQALETRVVRQALKDKITFAGPLPFAEVQARLALARLLALPSLSYEGFPLVIREAFSLAVPVAASRIGSLPCIVADGKTGVFFNPGSSGDLLRAVKDLWGDREKLEQMADAARMAFGKACAGDVNHDALMRIYDCAMSRRQERLSVRGRAFSR